MLVSISQEGHTPLHTPHGVIDTLNYSWLLFSPTRLLSNSHTTTSPITATKTTTTLLQIPINLPLWIFATQVASDSTRRRYLVHSAIGAISVCVSVVMLLWLLQNGGSVLCLMIDSFPSRQWHLSEFDLQFLFIESVCLCTDGNF